jgi:membrane protein
MLNRITTYFTTEIWNIRTRNLNQWAALWIYSIRVLYIAIRDFVQDDGSVRASALTYYTVLTIVPVLAMAFGIAQGFGFEENLQRQILSQFRGQEEIIEQIFTFVSATLERTKGGLIAGVGVVLLFYYVFRIMFNVENTMNAIWKVEETRPPIRKLTDYISLMILGPIVVILSGSLNVYIQTTIKNITSQNALLEQISPLINTPLRLLPYVMIWLVLTLVYMVMPNKKVNFVPALIAGIIAGTAYQVTQWGYITFQVGASNASAVYGSFAALPLFLIWVQLSWTIILFGAEISYAIQTRDLHEQRKDAAGISPYFKKILTLYTLHLIIDKFKNGEEALTDEELSKELDIPLPTIMEIVQDLTSANVISQTKVFESEAFAYQPARDTEKLNIVAVLKLLEKNGVNKLKMDASLAFQTIKEAVEGLENDNEKSDFNILLKTIANTKDKG